MRKEKRCFSLTYVQIELVDKTKIAFVILNWNNFELTKKAMESVIKVENEQEKCIIVVDNASNKDVVDKLIGFFENNRWNIIPEDEIGKRQINDNSPINFK